MAADRSLYFLPAARAEMLEAARRYERSRDGLGAAFIRAVESAVAIVDATPERWPLVPRVAPQRRAHQYLLKRFPFTVVYRLLGASDVEVIAVAHQKRRPAYWTKRLLP